MHFEFTLILTYYTILSNAYISNYNQQYANVNWVTYSQRKFGYNIPTCTCILYIYTVKFPIRHISRNGKENVFLVKAKRFGSMQFFRINLLIFFFLQCREKTTTYSLSESYTSN